MVAEKYKSNEQKGIREMVRYAGEDIKGFLKDHEKSSKQTARNYKTSIELFLEDVFNSTIDHITYEQLEVVDYDLVKAFRDNLYDLKKENGERVYKNSTINTRVAGVVAMFAELVARDKLKKVNVEALRSIKKLPDDSKATDYLSVEEGLAIAEYYNKPDNKSQLARNMFYVMLETAKRAEEVIQMKWEDLELVNGKIIWHSKGKGNKEFREVLPKELYHMLLSAKVNNEKVFPFSKSTARNRIVKAKEALGINKGSLHSLRRTTLTYVYNKTGNARLVQVKGNHSSFDTTVRYIQDNDIEANGVFSELYGVDQELYKNVEHGLLLEALGNMKVDMLMLLNAEIDRLKNK